jgi:hypothetical protein
MSLCKIAHFRGFSFAHRFVAHCFPQPVHTSSNDETNTVLLSRIVRLWFTNITGKLSIRTMNEMMCPVTVPPRTALLRLHRSQCSKPIRARANRDMDTDREMTQRKGMTAGGLAVCIGLVVIVAFPITARSAGGGVAALLENVAGLIIVLLLLIGLEKALRKRME